MRAVMIVVVAPGVDHVTGMAQARCSKLTRVLGEYT